VGGTNRGRWCGLRQRSILAGGRRPTDFYGSTDPPPSFDRNEDVPLSPEKAPSANPGAFRDASTLSDRRPSPPTVRQKAQASPAVRSIHFRRQQHPPARPSPSGSELNGAAFVAFTPDLLPPGRALICDSGSVILWWRSVSEQVLALNVAASCVVVRADAPHRRNAPRSITAKVAKAQSTGTLRRACRSRVEAFLLVTPSRFSASWLPGPGLWPALLWGAGCHPRIVGRVRLTCRCPPIEVAFNHRSDRHLHKAIDGRLRKR